jgi:hypothetical protein
VRLCGEAVDLLFRTAATKGTKSGRRLERYFRDMSELRTHGGTQADRTIETSRASTSGYPRSRWTDNHASRE